MDAVNTSSVPAHRAKLGTQMYTMKQVAELCGLAYASLWYHVQKETFPVEPIRIGKTYRFPKQSIDRLLSPDRDEPVEIANADE